MNTLVNRLLATTLAFILLGTSAFSAEIKMKCNLGKDTTSRFKVLFKYQDRFLMKDLAYGRYEGKWIEACDAYHKITGMVGVLSFTIEDSAVVCLHKYDKEEWGYETVKTIIDFEARTWSTYKDGNPASVLLGGGYPTSGDCN